MISKPLIIIIEVSTLTIDPSKMQEFKAIWFFLWRH